MHLCRILSMGFLIVYWRSVAESHLFMLQSHPDNFFDFHTNILISNGFFILADSALGVSAEHHSFQDIGI